MSAILLTKEFGITPACLHHSLINKFHLSKNTLPTLESYYILYWSGDYFAAQMCDGMITHQGKEYIVVYHRTTPEIVKKSEKVCLSFRSAKNRYHLSNYVLVNKVTQS